MSEVLDAFVSEDAAREIGVAMADLIYQKMQEGGILRRFMHYCTRHWVEEFTPDEKIRLARIKRRHRRLFLSMSDRQIVRTLRRG
jgi:hypothetical protein